MAAAPRPRVLLVSHRFEGEGGIEEHQGATARHLAGHVTFTAMAPRYSDCAIGISVLGVPAEPSDPNVEARFRHALEAGFDLVHFHSLLGWNTLRLPRIAREAGARVVLSVHDKSWQCADYNMVLGLHGAPCGRATARGNDGGCISCVSTKASAPEARTVGQVATWLEARHAAAGDALAAAHVVACPSTFAAANIRHAFGGSLPLHVISHGVPDWAPLEAPAPAEALRVACLGRFSARKGAMTLITAARALRGERIEIDAWGPVQDGLQALAQDAGIRLRGPYRNADLPSLLVRADLVIVPTQLEETFCLVVAEAQQLGVPVAASAVGAIPERVHEGKTGFLFPPGDPAAIAALLKRLRDDRSALDAVRIRLRENRQRTQADCASEYLALYQSIIGA